MTDAVKLRPPVVPYAVASRADRFVCTPYGIVITADTCCRRRALVRADIRKLEFLNCGEECAIGKVVEANSGGAMKVSARLAESTPQTGRHYKMAHAAKFGEVFEEDECGAAATKKDKRRVSQRKYYMRTKAEKDAKAGEAKR